VDEGGLMLPGFVLGILCTLTALSLYVRRQARLLEQRRIKARMRAYRADWR